MANVNMQTPAGTKVSLFDMRGTLIGFRKGIKRTAKNYCDGSTIDLTRAEAIIQWDGCDHEVGCEEFDVLEVLN
ncbi:MAG TPA: hypothetical protein VFM18_23595 [Methanosarcina sp.]|nr:hypothetical protein [Methanosarcina sp.]